MCQATTRSGAVKVAGSFKIKGFVVPFVQPIWFGCLIISVYLMMPARSTNLIASFEMDGAIDAWASAPVRTKSTLLLLCLHLHDILRDIVVITRNMSIRISASRVPHVHIGQSNTGQTCVQDSN